MRKKNLFFIQLLFCFLCIPAISNAQQPLQVVSSFSILTDLVEQVGGEHVQVYTLIKANTDAHSFEPSAQDARHLSGAQLVFANGLEFEPWLGRLTRASGFQGMTVLVSNGIVPLKIDGDEHEHESGHHEHEHEHGEYDPHAWQNVLNVVIYVQNIASALAQADPVHTEYYEKRAHDYIRELHALDTDISNSMKEIPRERRILVTAHDSFAYFADRYELTTFSALGVTNEALPSAAGIAQLIRQIRSQHIPALFLEKNINPRILEQVIRETNAVLGGSLYTDALSPEGTQADSYVKMMRANLTTLLNTFH